MDDQEFRQKITDFVQKYSIDGWELKETAYGVYALNARRMLNLELNESAVIANYYIDLDQVFKVPVFSATFFTESGHQLTYSEMLSILPEKIEEGSISEREHDLTGLPVFYIHPCKTHEFVQPFVADGADYLHVWLVKYGSILLYRLPF